jgi:NtrC-family two-component system sensor histidine kinase KinB
MMIRVEDKNCQFIFSIIPTRDRNGNLSDILFLMRDVTRIKEMEHIKNNFIMAASHELRTPLTSMGMSIDLLMEHVAPKLKERERDLIVTIYEEVQRMKSLTNELLDFSRMEAGKISLELKSITLKDIFEQASDVFRNQFEIRNITLESEFPEDLPEVIAYEKKILWVLSNLISNASRYVESGGHIRINADLKGFYVHIAVEDDGSGIPIETQSKLFQKVTQVNNGQSVETGLGLAICQ